MNPLGEGCSEPRLHHCTTLQPGQQSKTLCQKKKRRPGTVAHTFNPSTLGDQGRWIIRSRDRDYPGQHGETPSLLKIQKVAGCLGSHLSFQLLRRLRQENCLNPGGRGCSEQTSRHCTPAWGTEQIPSQKKKLSNMFHLQSKCITSLVLKIKRYFLLSSKRALIPAFRCCFLIRLFSFLIPQPYFVLFEYTHFLL